MKEALTRVRRDLGGDAVILVRARGPAAAAFRAGSARALIEVTATRHHALEDAAHCQPAGQVIVVRRLASSPALGRRCRRSSASSSAGCTRWSRL